MLSYLQSLGKIFLVALFFLFSINPLKSQNLHTSSTCPTGTVAGNVIWNDPAGADEFDWTNGSLTYTASNVSGTEVDVIFTWAGETGSLAVFGGVQTPDVQSSLSGGTEAVTLVTNGFTGSGMTLTMTLSPPIPGYVGYELYHMNKTGAAGDEYFITATTTAGNTIFPTFSANATPSWSQTAAGTVNGHSSSTAGQNDQVGVNFFSNEYISTITMRWRDCQTCSNNQFHGAAFGSFDFCIDDWDKDGKHNEIDVDDDNDGILDADEQCSNSNGAGALDWNAQNWPSGSATASFTVGTVTINGSVTSDGNALNVINDDNTFTGGFGSGQESLRLEVNQSSNASIVTNSWSFSEPVDDLSFRIFDVDRSGTSFRDDVRVIGYGYGAQIFPTLTGSSANTVNLNTAEGTGSSSSSSSNGNVLVQFPEMVDSVVVYYGNADGTNANPSTQAIAIHDFSWTRSCPSYDIDGDNIPNHFDLDTENDGVFDLYESGISYSQYASLDSDGNGVIDLSNNVGTNGYANVLETVANNGIPNYTYADTDNDGILNRVDLDSDNDGITDVRENGLGTDANNDGIVDGSTDVDKDGILSSADSDDDVFGSASNLTPNSDNDQLADFMDIDSDNDGIIDNIEAQGNTGSPLRPGGTDTDGDGLDNNFESGSALSPIDTDGDGREDFRDNDSDNDGDSDLLEGYDTDNDGVANTTASGSDTDGDGLDNSFDNVNGINSTTNVSNNNQDALDFPNLDNTGTAERDWREILDTDNDGVPDGFDFDSDNDGISDAIELNCTSGFADAVTLDQGVGSENNALGAPDNAVAVVSTNDALTVDLTETVGEGRAILLRIGRNNTALVRVEGSADNVTFTNPTTYGNTSSPDVTLPSVNTLYNRYYVAGDNGVRYVRITYLAGSTDVDAVAYAPNCTSVDTDGDGVPDHKDLDSDNDGIVDLIEAGGVDTDGDGRIDASVDTDGDGIQDQYDSNNGGDAITIPDSDGDGIANYKDADSDNDGIPDVVEAGGTDTNGDGRFDDAGTDTDNDGLPDDIDGDVGNDGVAENSANVLIRSGTDTNSDGIPDSYVAGDADGDGHLNHVDTDSDNDGIPDVVEAGGTDTNGDGRFDDAGTDSDNDGLADDVDGDVGNDGVAENNANALTKTGTDTNNDGRPNSTPNDDQDQDGVLNQFDIDSDNDGIVDVTEAGGTANATGTLSGVDSDNDGLIDSVDGDVGNDGVAENLANVLVATGTDTNNDGAPNSLPTDNPDGDNLYNFYDIDSDGDGIIDNIEAQITTSATEPNSSDTDGDGLSNTFENGGLTPVDTDSDGTADYLDTDSDDDRIPDNYEGWDTDNDYLPNTVSTGSDTDGDGLDNAYDNVNGINATTNVTNNGQDGVDFPNLDNTSTTQRDWREDEDRDGDGIADFEDADADNDGIPNANELGSNAPYGDEDGDGIPNFLDVTDNGNGGDGSTTNYADANGDGLPDAYDLDRDGIPNHLDLDSDGDGITDIQESGIPAATLSTIDANNDGVIDGGVSVGTNGIANTLETSANSGTLNYTVDDSDSDGLIDSQDLDSDNDGITDLAESGTGTDANNDGIVDGSADADRDGIADSADSNDGAFGTPNTVATDSDGDGTPNFRDLDSDNDGATDLAESGTGTDANNDGVIDGSADTDGDGILNSADSNDGSRGTPNTTPLNTDGDNLANFLDLDSDNDGLSDLVESGSTGTDANNDGRVDGSADTDGDGILNSADANDGAFGSVGTAPVNTDGDSVADFIDLDSDNDGLTDALEANGGTLPANVSSQGQYAAAFVNANDTDNDGMTNAVDPNNGGTVITPTNTDGTGNPDHRDIDADGDGIIDLIEAQTTAGYTSLIGTDTDGDGIDNRFDPDNSGASLTPINTDGADLADYRDTDSDNDGRSDLIEGHDNNSDGTANTTPSGADSDNDGLDNAFDPDNGGCSNTGLGQPGNGGCSALQNTDGTDDRDWRDNDDDNDGIPTANEPGDSDGNGTADYLETFDQDLDGVADHLDGDHDNDGIPNSTENGGLDATGDADNDGIPNYRDADFCVLANGVCASMDFDGDGVINSFDLDSDNDGIPDAREANGGVLPASMNANGQYPAAFAMANDTDNDGVANPVDLNNGGALLPVNNTDGQGGADFLDRDSDNDGITDAIEGGGTDANGDGIIDGFADADGDGLANSLDSDNGGSALAITNTDGDALADYRDIDADNDGIIDNIEAQTSGSYESPSGSDADGDGIDNTYDPDVGTALPLTNSDNAGVPDYLDADSDDDGVSDLLEGHDANSNDIADWDDNSNGVLDVSEGNADSDGDGLLNAFDPDNGGCTNSGFGQPGNGGCAALQVNPNFGVAGLPDFRNPAFALPIELLHFTAELVNDEVHLDWATLTEIDNDFFVIEKTKDGKGFEQVGVVDGAGTSTQRIDYDLVDPNPYHGVSFYRLKQQDFDGRYKYSGLVKVEYLNADQSPSSLIQVYPNPTTNQVNITVEQELLGNKVRLLDAAGKVLNAVQLSELNTEVSLEGHSAGVYILEVTNEREVVLRRRVIKLEH